MPYMWLKPNRPRIFGVLALAAVVGIIGGCQSPHDAEPTFDVSLWPADLVTPIPGATFSLVESHLPGAPRAGNKGINEGFDFFPGSSGRPLAADEPVVAVADGTIIRIDHEYQDQPAEKLEFWVTQLTTEGFVRTHALDQLRGRQVWIRHAEEHISRYAHLSAVHPELQLGDRVEQGQVIGLMGKSGVPRSEDNPEPLPHLHFQLWSADGATFLGADLSALDTHRLIAQLFGATALPRYARGMVQRVNAGQQPPEIYPPAELPDIGFNADPPERVAEGRVFAIPVLWEGDDFGPGDFFAYLEDLPLGVIDAGDGVWILGAMPTGIDANALKITIGAVDPFGGTMAGSRPIRLDPAQQRSVPKEVDAAIFDAHSPETIQFETEQLTPAVLQSGELVDSLWQQPFDVPVNGDLRRPFGQRIFHGVLRPDFPLPGVVVDVPQGTPVQAANSGIVGLVADLPIRGRTVAIIHGGGLVSIYAHLEEASVSVGDEIAINQRIGTAGATGAVTEPGLRWEMLVSGIPTDPLQWPGQVLPGRR